MPASFPSPSRPTVPRAQQFFFPFLRSSASREKATGVVGETGGRAIVAGLCVSFFFLPLFLHVSGRKPMFSEVKTPRQSSRSPLFPFFPGDSLASWARERGAEVSLRESGIGPFSPLLFFLTTTPGTVTDMEGGSLGESPWRRQCPFFFFFFFFSFRCEVSARGR